MKTSIHKLLTISALVLPGFLLNPASADNYDLTVSGASPGGLWSLLGAGLDSAIKAEHSGSTITYQTSGGGIANVGILERDDASLAIVENAVLQKAKQGEPPFRKPIKNIRAIANLYSWAPMQALIRKDIAEEYDIEKFSDIAKEKAPLTIALNKRGNIASSVAEAMLKSIGAGPEQIEKWGGNVVYAASGEQSNLIQDRRIDMMLNSLFIRHSSIMQASSNVDLKLLPISEETIKNVSENTGTNYFVIPKDTYEWAPNDTPTLTISAILAVRSDMNEKTAYELSKSFYENYKKISTVHPAMKQLNPKVMSSVSITPFHKGALRYLEEAELK